MSIRNSKWLTDLSFTKSSELFFFNRDIINKYMYMMEMARMVPSKYVFLLYFQLEFRIYLELSGVSVGIKTACPC